ncbi:Bacterial Ig-like domain (group 2) [compost metagenome]
MNAVSCVKAAPAQVVSLALTPANASVMAQSTQQYVATATLSDNTTQDVSASVAWSSSNTAIATIDASGLATGVAVGSSVISATMQDGSSISATAQLSVTPPCYPLPNLFRNGKEWTAPLLKCDADARGIPYAATDEDVGQVWVKMVWSQASSYCASLGNGYYLPAKMELYDLAQTGNLEADLGWVTSYDYWASEPGFFGHASVQMFYSTISHDNSDTSPFYASCARPASR